MSIYSAECDAGEALQASYRVYGIRLLVHLDSPGVVDVTSDKESSRKSELNEAEQIDNAAASRIV